MMGYGLTEVETYCGVRTGAVWPAVGSLPRPVCAGCGQWPVWLRARDQSALEVAPPDHRLDRQPTAFTTMCYTNRQPLPFTFTFSLCLIAVNLQHCTANTVVML